MLEYAGLLVYGQVSGPDTNVANLRQRKVFPALSLHPARRSKHCYEQNAHGDSLLPFNPELIQQRCLMGGEQSDRSYASERPERNHISEVVEVRMKDIQIGQPRRGGKPFDLDRVQR